MNDHVKICDMLSDSLVKPSRITAVDMADLASDTTVITVRCGTKWRQRYRRVSKRRRMRALSLELGRALNSLIGKRFNDETLQEAYVLVNDVLDRVIRPVTVTLRTPPRR